MFMVELQPQSQKSTSKPKPQKQLKAYFHITLYIGEYMAGDTR